jgi:hypothetical protein
MSVRCDRCERKGFITESEVFMTEEGNNVRLKWCSNVHCDYNERLIVKK